MQVWQTVSSSRQRARNAERITKKPHGGSEPGAVLVDVGSVPLYCGYKNNKPFPRYPFLFLGAITHSQMARVWHCSHCGLSIFNQQSWLQIMWQSHAKPCSQLPCWDDSCHMLASIKMMILGMVYHWYIPHYSSYLDWPPMAKACPGWPLTRTPAIYIRVGMIVRCWLGMYDIGDEDGCSALILDP